MVYGELGAYPLFIDIQYRMVSLWAKLRDGGHNEIATNLYKIINRLKEKEKIKSKWLDHVKYIINSNGFGHV